MAKAVKVAAPRRFPAFRRGLAFSAAKAFLKRVRRRCIRLGTPNGQRLPEGLTSREQGRTRWSNRRRRSVWGGRPVRVGPHRRISTSQARRGRNPAPTRPPPSASKSPRNQHALAAESAKPTRQPVERFGSSNSMGTWTFIAWPDDMIYIGRCRAAGRNGRATRNVQSGV